MSISVSLFETKFNVLLFSSHDIMGPFLWLLNQQCLTEYGILTKLLSQILHIQ